MKPFLLAFAGLLATAVLAQSPEWQKLTDEAIALHRQGQSERALVPAQQALDLAITYAALGQVPLAEQYAEGQVIEGLNLKLLSAPQSPGRGSDKK
jgi:hypothetical protein